MLSSAIKLKETVFTSQLLTTNNNCSNIQKGIVALKGVALKVTHSFVALWRHFKNCHQSHQR